MCRWCSLVAFLVVALAAVAERQFELRGQIEPAPERASVTIYGAEFPYSASTLSDLKGRFRFRRLAQGSYTVSVFVPGRGEARQTVAVGPSLADSKGRIAVTIPFSPSEASLRKGLERRNTISLRELSISDRAREEYDEAQKKLSRRDVEGAVWHLERAVELAPQFMAAWNNLGTIAYQSRQYEKAEKYFREALEQQPGAFEPVVNLGGALLSQSRYSDALQYNQYAVMERPDDALANSQLGINYFYLGDSDKALKYLNAAKRADPAHFSHPQLILAEIYAGRGDRRAAIRELEDFLARHPDAPDAETLRRRIERLRGRADER